ncbi:HD-GYP domain-containing protein [Caldisalinibacter kiritimatiensis]|uniref:Putative metal-dependent phosphohydrolase n=1 Tax=Caldisalinibacter kiritimatiensis TaxID=1304284 RepID=R1CPH7_9FIRM|nr:HD-GYP domain-containing protein [Caldisalinibacter kiritimatiensis]EOD00571.1 Putative metal-dependent phosphohydrolase [Caldisalinibacter kiritimatiensis]
MALIHIDNVEPGMVLKKDVENIQSGIILLKSGTVLNKKNIIHIKNNGIEYIDILEKVSHKKDYVLIQDEKFCKAHKKLVHKTKDILNNVRLGKKIIITEISDTVDNIVEELIKNNNILGRLRRLKENDDYTFSHSLNVSMLATMVGKWLNYSKVELKQLALAGLFHDIGKMKIPQDIINKPGKLTEKEFEIIKKHTIYGYNILNNTIGISKNIALGALQHHEREDGSGYPLRVKSEKIHEFAKIIAVCDIFDAMTSDRVYKEKESPFTVAELINNNSFGVLDPRISFLFLNNISKFYVGNIVKLSTYEIGEIVYVHRELPTRPVVKVDEKYVDLLKEKNIHIIDVID